MKKYIVLMITLSFILSACGKGDKNPTLAKVNGIEITKEQFDAFLKFKRIADRNDKKQSALLDQYIEREALASMIEKDDLIDKTMTQAELNEFKKEMLITRYFETYLNDTVTDQSVQNYYNTHAGDYEEKKAHVAHILIRTNKKMSEPERMAKLTTAQEAYSKIKSGKSFNDIAKDYSEDKVSSPKGGDLGWLKQGSISPKFSDTVLSMKPGEVSEPFETPFGFHVVTLLEEPKVIRQAFETVSGNIRYQLRLEAKNAEMERLMKKAKIKRMEQ